MNRANILLSKFNEADLHKIDKNQKHLLTMYVEAINNTNNSFMLCKLNQIKEGIQYQVNNLSKVMLDVSEARIFHTKADALLSTFQEMLTSIEKFETEVISENQKMESMGITLNGPEEEEALKESYISEGQQGNIHVMVDLGMTGICPDKDKIEKVFNKRKAEMLKGLDADFIALGLTKGDKK